MRKTLTLLLALLMAAMPLAALAQDEAPPTLLTIGSAEEVMSTPVSGLETLVMQHLFETANVTIDHTYYDEDRFNLMLASQDLPDLVWSRYAARLDNVLEAGLALDLWPLVEEQAPNMLHPYYEQTYDLIRALKGGPDEALYFLTNRVGYELTGGGVDNNRGYSVRWDYYKELGAPPITDDDAFIEILEQIVAAHPETEDGRKVYATGNYDTFGQWYTRGAFVKPTLRNIWTFPNTLFMSGFDDNVLYDCYTDVENSPFWADMVYYNKLYSKGLLDPDSFTQTIDEVNAKHEAGQYIAGTNIRVARYYARVSKEDPNTIAGSMQVPSENAIVFADKKLLLGNFPTWFGFVSSRSENVDAVMRLLDAVHDLDMQRAIYSGFEGEQWNYVDGVPVYTDEVKEMLRVNDEELYRIGLKGGFGCGLFTLFQASFLHPDGYPMGLSETDEMRASTLNPMLQDFADFYEVPYPGAASYRLVEEGKTIDMSNDMGQLIATAMEPIPSDIARIIERCNNIVYRAVPSLVMAQSEEEFEAIRQQVMADLEAANEATAWAWCLDNYNTGKAIVEPIFLQSDLPR